MQSWSFVWSIARLGLFCSIGGEAFYVGRNIFGSQKYVTCWVLALQLSKGLTGVEKMFFGLMLQFQQLENIDDINLPLRPSAVWNV